MAPSADQTESTDSLLLVPTRLELELVQEFWPDPRSLHDALESDSKDATGIRIGVCGFGLVAAAAQTSRLLARLKPRRVWLLGIAGTYRNEEAVGQAFCFDQVACYGIGVGTGTQFQSAASMGWQQWPGDAVCPSIGDRIELNRFTTNRHSSCRTTALQLEMDSTLLSVTAASESPQDAELRRRFCPAAVAEDMEGFGVAVACRLEQIPLTILRGISNVAGDRNPSHWKIREAMKSAVEMLPLNS